MQYIKEKSDQYNTNAHENIGIRKGFPLESSKRKPIQYSRKSTEYKTYECRSAKTHSL